MIDINKIKPKLKGESDKYSWNFYNFLRKQFNKRDDGKYIKKQIKVFWLTRSQWDGKYLEFDPSNLNKGMNQIIISSFGGKSGYFFNSILRGVRLTNYYMPYADEELIDITEWFFNTYEKDGRCIFDRNHDRWMTNTDDRFTYVGNTRRCNWCGEWHHKTIEKKVKIELVDNWVKEPTLKTV